MSEIFEVYSKDEIDDQVIAPLADMASYYNVKAHGAKGDGVTDDTSAIQSALNTVVTTNQRVYVPYGTYKITSTILMNANTTLICDPGATFVITGGNIHGVEMFDNNTIENLKIDFGANTDSTKSALHVNGLNYIKYGRVSNLVIEGNRKGKGIYLDVTTLRSTVNPVYGSGSPYAYDSVINFVHFINFKVHYCERGIAIKNGTDTGSANGWADQCLFIGELNNNDQSIDTDCDSSMFFLVGEAGSNNTLPVVNCKGRYNNITFSLLDVENSGLNNQYITLTNTSDSNIINIPAKNLTRNAGTINDYGVNNVISGRPLTTDIYGLPQSNFNMYDVPILGNQDDCLSFIDKIGTVTPSSSSGGIYATSMTNMFRPDGTKGIVIFDGTSPGTYTLTINLTNNPLVNPRMFGIAFSNGTWCSNVQVTFTYSDSTTFTRSSLDGNNNPLWANRGQLFWDLAKQSNSNLDKSITQIQIVFTKTTSGSFHVSRIFCAGGNKASSYLTKDTESIYGDHKFITNTNGPILTDRTNGHTYRLLVNNGVLSVEQVT
jgi:hypothetical protein